MKIRPVFFLTLLTCMLSAALVNASLPPHPAASKIRAASHSMYGDPLGSKHQLFAIRKAYPHLPDTLQAEYWVTLSTCYGMLHRYDSAIHLALKAQALKMNETTRVFALKTLGSLYMKSNQLEKADSVFQVAIDQASKRPRSEILQAILLGEWSNVFLNRSDYERTIKMLKKAMKLCAQAPKRDPETELILQSKMADTYRISEQLPFAERSFLDILNSPDSILRKEMRGNIMLALNEVWQKQERYRESDSILLQALPLFESLNNLESIGYTQAMMAKNMLFRGNTRGGLVLMKSAYPKIRSTQSTTLLEIGALYLRMLRPYGLDNPEAHQLINDTLIQSLQKNNYNRDHLDFQRAALPFLQNMLSPEAFLSRVSFIQALSDSVYQSGKWVEILRLQAQYQLSLKEKNEALLASENKLLAKRSQFNGLLAIALAILLGMVVFVGLFLSTRIHLKNQTIAADNALKAQKIDWLSQRVELEVQELSLKEAVIEQLERRLEQNTVDEFSAGQNVLATRLDALKEGKNQQSAFLTQFSTLYPHFISNLCAQFPELSKTDVLFCALYRIGLGYRDIGKALNIETTSVYKRRYRIEEKMGLNSDDELNKVLFGL